MVVQKHCLNYTTWCYLVCKEHTRITLSHRVGQLHLSEFCQSCYSVITWYFLICFFFPNKTQANCTVRYNRDRYETSVLKYLCCFFKKQSQLVQLQKIVRFFFFPLNQNCILKISIQLKMSPHLNIKLPSNLLSYQI